MWCGSALSVAGARALANTACVCTSDANGIVIVVRAPGAARVNRASANAACGGHGSSSFVVTHQARLPIPRDQGQKDVFRDRRESWGNIGGARGVGESSFRQVPFT